eukprot:TRINITY_DN2904_c0_g1_i1.p1 TRINITY_DN2904_c0_g1~~TRINITY_DN2904_c0_g1_i1.p1  ORF type:complete len:636 (+),score=150.68 TRINITY_DN2904_c0_g1_i1:30-1910(+)
MLKDEDLEEVRLVDQREAGLTESGSSSVNRKFIYVGAAIAVILLTCLVIAIVVFSGDKIPTGLNGDELSEEYWHTYLKMYPEIATYYGGEFTGAYTDDSPEGVVKNKEIWEALQKKLESVTTAGQSADHNLNVEILKETLKYDIEGYDWFMYVTINFNNQMDGPWFTLPSEPSYMNFGEDTYAAYITRLRGIKDYLERVQAWYSLGVEKNVTLPRVIAELLPPQVDALIAIPPLESSFFAPFKNLPPAKKAIRDEALLVITDVVYPAFTLLADYLDAYVEKCRTTIGAEALPNGVAFYQSQIDLYTTSGMKPAEIHQLGLDEVARISNEMAKIANQRNMSLPEFQAYLKTAKEYYAETEEEFLMFVRNYAKKADALLPLWFKTLPRCPYGVQAIPAASAPTAAGAYYNSPDFECSRPGMVSFNTYDLESRPLYTVPSTGLHEGVPGHHLQISLSIESPLPQYRRDSHWNAYVEGWALYSESLGEEVGYYDEDVVLHFGRYVDEIFRAVRLVVDTGMHTGNMTRQEAIDYMSEKTGLGASDVKSEIDRYIAWPGQALGYKLGELTIKDIRKNISEAFATMNETFDLREFHDRLITNGAMPLTLLRSSVYQRYCSEGGAQWNSLDICK